MRRALAVIVAAMALAGCDDTAAGADPKKPANAARYERDRQFCEAQADQIMRRRRNIDDSRRDVFRDPNDNFGRSALPDTMSALGDNRSSDRVVQSCLESRGWAAPQKPWWQRLGS